MKKLTFITLALLCTLTTVAQTTVNAPTPAWKSITWAPVDFNGASPHTQDESGEDWWYDHKNVVVNGEHIGYITCGYATWATTTNFNQTYGCFKCEKDLNNFGCDQLETLNRRKLCAKGTIAFFDLQGRMRWCRAYNWGALFSVQPTSDGGFIAIGNSDGNALWNSTTPMVYNPGNGNGSGPFDTGVACNQGEGKVHLVVVKTDNQGNVQWSYLYGMEDYLGTGAGAWDEASFGFDIVEKPSGGYKSVGYAGLAVNADANAFVLDIDANGQWVDGNLFGDPNFPSEARAITMKSDGSEFIIAGYERRNSNFSGTVKMATLRALDANNAEVWSPTPRVIDVSDDGSGSNQEQSWDITYNQQEDRLLWPVIIKCNFCTNGGTPAIAQGRVYQIDPTNGNDINFTSNNLPYLELGEVRAYDLKIGITATDDDGFAVVSSKKQVSNTVCDDNIMDIPCDDCNHHLDVWETDAYIEKFAADGTSEWETIFDSHNEPAKIFPDDTKKQECLYHITQTPDGGYVIDGNTSHNFDDNYLVKLNSPCQKTIAYTDNNDVSNTGVTVWNADRIIEETVTIPNGGTLRIEGFATKIQFADYRHYNDIDDITNNTLSVRPGIVVEPGGTLIVEDALITGIEDPACEFNGMWEGIRVLGNPNASQQPASNQGQVILDNATIKNAFAAVTVDNSFFDINGLPINGSSAGGGILKATDSRFENNYRDVVFGHYQSNNNVSFLVNCTLETTAPLVDPNLVDVFGDRLTTQHHVLAYGVNGVDVKGCTFRNTGNFLLQNRGTGIASWDCRFNVVPQCIQPGFPNCITEQPNRFENLYYGIYDAGIFPDKTILVKRNEFVDVQRGITVRGKNTPIITGNTFDLGDGISPEAYGIYLNEAIGYQVEENIFTGKELASNGILLYNTGNIGNELYKNDFTDVGVGIQMQGQPQLNSNSGLQIKCNNFFIDNTGQVADIGIVSGIIHPQQGDIFCLDEEEMSGNQFSHTCANSEGDYLDNPKNQNFFYSTNADNGFTAPVCFASNINDIICSNLPYDEEITCPSNLDKDENELKSNINSIAAEIIAKSNLVDGGDTDGLQELISTGSNGQVKNGLLGASPYLSDTVLLAYINSNPPNGHIKSVLLANSPLDSTVYAALQELNLPNGIQNQVDAAQDGSLSPMDELALELGYLQGQREINVNALVRFYLSDSTVVNGLDSAIQVLANEPAVEYQCWLSSIYIANGNFTAAQAILDSLNGTAGLTAFCQFQQIGLSLGVGGNFLVPVLKVDENLQAQMEAFGADSLIQGSIFARNALEAAFGYINEPYIQELNIPMMKTAGNSGDDEQETVEIKQPESLGLNTKSETIVKVYPNPTQGNLTIEYLGGKEDAQLMLFDMAGKRVYAKKVLPNKTQNINLPLAKGVYMYLITVNDTTIANNKLVILK